jgi:hypothetical protein
VNIRRWTKWPSRIVRWITPVLCLLLFMLIMYGVHHSTGVRGPHGFEVRLIADHIIVLWQPNTRWPAFDKLTWYREPQHIASPVFILFSPRHVRLPASSRSPSGSR